MKNYLPLTLLGKQSRVTLCRSVLTFDIGTMRGRASNRELLMWKGAMHNRRPSLIKMLPLPGSYRKALRRHPSTAHRYPLAKQMHSTEFHTANHRAASCPIKCLYLPDHDFCRELLRNRLERRVMDYMEMGITQRTRGQMLQVALAGPPRQVVGMVAFTHRTRAATPITQRPLNRGPVRLQGVRVGASFQVINHQLFSHDKLAAFNTAMESMSSLNQGGPMGVRDGASLQVK